MGAAIPAVSKTPTMLAQCCDTMVLFRRTYESSKALEGWPSAPHEPAAELRQAMGRCGQTACAEAESVHIEKR